MSKLPRPVDILKADVQRLTHALNTVRRTLDQSTAALKQEHAQKQMLLQMLCGMLTHMNVTEYELPTDAVDQAMLDNGYRLTTNVIDKDDGTRVVQLVTTPFTDAERAEFDTQRAEHEAAKKRDDDPKESRIIIP